MDSKSILHIQTSNRHLFLSFYYCSFRTKSQKEQVEFAVDIGAQIQATARRVQKERKVILSYKISGNDDGPNRGRKSGKTRLPAAEVPPPKIRNEEDSIVGDTMKMVADEMNRVVNLSLE